MAGSVDNIRPRKCHEYANFLATQGRLTFELVYWTLFCLVLFLLLFTSNSFSRLMKNAGSKPAPGRSELKRLQKKCLYSCVLCFLLSIVANVFEVYALLALQFCDGEDLMALYWASWTAMQFGAVIAILGTVLSLIHQLQESNHPPWALALGTPILIFTGVGDAVHNAVRGPVQRLRSRSRRRSNSVQTQGESVLHISRQDTLDVGELSQSNGSRRDDAQLEEQKKAD